MRVKKRQIIKENQHITTKRYLHLVKAVTKILDDSESETEGRKEQTNKQKIRKREWST